MANLKIIVIIVLLGLFTVLVMQNTEVIDVQFFAYEVTMSRIVLMLLTLLLGFIVGFITAKQTGRHRRAKKQARREERARNEEQTQAHPEPSLETSTPVPSEHSDS